MKKKIKDLTHQEQEAICASIDNCCSKCPLQAKNFSFSNIEEGEHRNWCGHWLIMYSGIFKEENSPERVNAFLDTEVEVPEVETSGN